jgi:hypothetical protein
VRVTDYDSIFEWLSTTGVVERLLALPPAERPAELRKLVTEQFDTTSWRGWPSDSMLSRFFADDGDDAARIEKTRLILARFICQLAGVDWRAHQRTSEAGTQDPLPALRRRPANLEKGPQKAPSSPGAEEGSDPLIAETEEDEPVPSTPDPTDAPVRATEHAGDGTVAPPPPPVHRPPTADDTGGSGDGTDPDQLRAVNGVRVVYAGFAVVLVAFVVAVVAYAAAGDVSTALAPVTGVVGALVGAYFGVQVGSQGKEATERQADARVQRAEAARLESERDAKLLAAVAPPDLAAQVLNVDLR